MFLVVFHPNCENLDGKNGGCRLYRVFYGFGCVVLASPLVGVCYAGVFCWGMRAGVVHHAVMLVVWFQQGAGRADARVFPVVGFSLVLVHSLGNK